MNTKKTLPSEAGGTAPRNIKRMVVASILVLVLGGVAVLFVKGRDDALPAGDLSNPVVDVVRDVPGKSLGGGKKAIGGRRGAKRGGGGMVRGKRRINTRLVEDDDDEMDDLPPEDRRLLTAIEEGVDDDNLEKILEILPEASASTNTEVRSELVDALGGFGVPAMNHLLPFMADADDDVRQDAIDNWTSALGEIEDEKTKAGLITAVMQVLNDEDALESMTSELIGMDEKMALQVLVDVVEGGKAPKQAVAAAKEQYEFLTGDEYTTVEDANKWLAENYEPPDRDNAANGN